MAVLSNFKVHLFKIETERKNDLDVSNASNDEKTLHQIQAKSTILLTAAVIERETTKPCNTYRPREKQ